MNTKLIVSALALAGASTLRAAGVTWSYDGDVMYDEALIVWTDPGINPIGAEEEIRSARDRVLSRLQSSEPASVAALGELCANALPGNVVLTQTIEPPFTDVRVRHTLGYVFDHTGWGFTLLVKLDESKNITEYAINEVTEAIIVSEAVKDTELTIGKDDLTTDVSAYASARILSAGAPDIVAHEPLARMIVDQDPETFVFDITNAVSGITYRVIGANELSKTFMPIGVDVTAALDGRLSFSIPIDPNEKVMFYRVAVGNEND